MPSQVLQPSRRFKITESEDTDPGFTELHRKWPLTAARTDRCEPSTLSLPNWTNTCVFLQSNQERFLSRQAATQLIRYTSHLYAVTDAANAASTGRALGQSTWEDSFYSTSSPQERFVLHYT